MLIHPQSQLLREPNLLVPGRKSIGPVKINWSHPLTSGLQKLYLLPGKVDLVRSDRLTSVGTSEPTIVVKDGVQARYFTAGDDTGYYTMPVIDFPASTAKMGLVVFNNYNQINGNHEFLFSYKDAYNENFQVYRKAWGTMLEASSRNGSAATKPLGTTNVRDTGWHVAAVYETTPGGTHPVYLYLNGNLEASATQDNGNSAWTTITECYIGNSNPTNTNWAGTIAVHGLWLGKTWSDAELKSITANPYQFLVPA